MRLSLITAIVTIIEAKGRIKEESHEDDQEEGIRYMNIFLIDIQRIFRWISHYCWTSFGFFTNMGP